jgi:hypothetical protein
MPRHAAQGVRVLELGCGCGLVGLCFAACGADVLLTDLPDPLVRPYMHAANSRPPMLPSGDTSRCIGAAGGFRACKGA